MTRFVPLLIVALLLGVSCAGDDAGGGEPTDGGAGSDEKTYAGMTRAEAREAIEQTIPEANQWIADNAGNAQVGEPATIEPLADFIPGSGGEEAWAAQLALEGDIFGNPNPEICMWVWADPIEEGYFRTQYNLCG